MKTTEDPYYLFLYSPRPATGAPVASTPFNAPVAHDLLDIFVNTCVMHDVYVTYALSPVDESASFYPGWRFSPVKWKKLIGRLLKIGNPAMNAFAEWIAHGRLTEAGRAMVDPARSRDPLEVEEFECYLDDVVAGWADMRARAALARMALVRDRTAAAHRQPMWWAARCGKFVYA